MELVRLKCCYSLFFLLLFFLALCLFLILPFFFAEENHDSIRKSCWAMHVVTKNKCTAKIVSNSKSTPGPAYTEVNTSLQYLRSRSSFFAMTTLNVVSKDHVESGSTNSLLTKNDLRSRPSRL